MKYLQVSTSLLPLILIFVDDASLHASFEGWKVVAGGSAHPAGRLARRCGHVVVVECGGAPAAVLPPHILGRVPAVAADHHEAALHVRRRLHHRVNRDLARAVQHAPRGHARPRHLLRVLALPRVLLLRGGGGGQVGDGAGRPPEGLPQVLDVDRLRAAAAAGDHCVRCRCSGSQPCSVERGARLCLGQHRVSIIIIRVIRV